MDHSNTEVVLSASVSTLVRRDTAVLARKHKPDSVELHTQSIQWFTKVDVNGMT